jgi:hypothetical protein
VIVYYYKIGCFCAATALKVLNILASPLRNSPSLILGIYLTALYTFIFLSSVFVGLCGMDKVYINRLDE